MNFRVLYDKRPELTENFYNFQKIFKFNFANFAKLSPKLREFLEILKLNFEYFPEIFWNFGFEFWVIYGKLPSFTCKITINYRKFLKILELNFGQFMLSYRKLSIKITGIFRIEFWMFSGNISKSRIWILGYLWKVTIIQLYNYRKLREISKKFKISCSSNFG